MVKIWITQDRTTPYTKDSAQISDQTKCSRLMLPFNVTKTVKLYVQLHMLTRQITGTEV